ncbi:hypothetical protein [Carnobacterium divergens]|uniref:hypothetical protein n=1 Tax=Carnobacterium divergens TaxID=2748 RepID=UPI0039AF44D6
MLEINKKWILVIIIGIVTMVLIIGGKKYMDKKSAEKEYQDGVELIQNYVTDYLVHNYEGIEKIEWQGVGVEWRNSKTRGSSLFGNYINSYVKVYISRKQYCQVGFTLSDETNYDNNLKKYVLLNSLNPENIDSLLEMEIRNTTRHLNAEDKLHFKKIEKSSKGSPNAKIVYNLDIHELKY